MTAAEQLKQRKIYFRDVYENMNMKLSIKTSLKWLTVAMPLLETRERQERGKRDKRETRERWS